MRAGPDGTIALWLEGSLDLLEQNPLLLKEAVTAALPFVARVVSAPRRMEQVRELASFATIHGIGWDPEKRYLASVLLLATLWADGRLAPQDAVALMYDTALSPRAVQSNLMFQCVQQMSLGPARLAVFTPQAMAECLLTWCEPMGERVPAAVFASIRQVLRVLPRCPLCLIGEFLLEEVKLTIEGRMRFFEACVTNGSSVRCCMLFQSRDSIAGLKEDLQLAVALKESTGLLEHLLSQPPIREVFFRHYFCSGSVWDEAAILHAFEARVRSGKDLDVFHAARLCDAYSVGPQERARLLYRFFERFDQTHRIRDPVRRHLRHCALKHPPDCSDLKCSLTNLVQRFA